MKTNYGIKWDHTANIQLNVSFNLTKICSN